MPSTQELPFNSGRARMRHRAVSLRGLGEDAPPPLLRSGLYPVRGKRPAPFSRAAFSTPSMVRTTAAAPEISMPARSSNPPLDAKAFCMSTTTTADFAKSTSSGSGRVCSLLVDHPQRLELV